MSPGAAACSLQQRQGPLNHESRLLARKSALPITGHSGGASWQFPAVVGNQRSETIEPLPDRPGGFSYRGPRRVAAVPPAGRRGGRAI